MKSFEITCPYGREPRTDDIRKAAAEALHLRRNAIVNVIDPVKSFQPTMLNADAVCRISHRSVDARGDVRMVYRIDAYYADEGYSEYQPDEYLDVRDAEPVIVVGSGPAGMFAALKLLTLGYKPIVLERGKDVHRRKKDMAELSRTGLVDPDSNYCYGEGGAGAFSDGKLFTRSSKRGDNREVLYQLVGFGCDRSILIDARPHIGSDKLPRIVENIRKCITDHGGEYHFDCRVEDITLLKTGKGIINVKAVDSSGAKPRKTVFKAAAVILATGHSATDIYEMAAAKGWELAPKGFALGVRVEHPQALVNKMRYRGQWEPGMPAADYSFVEKVVDTDGDERGVFSFCMCPGGILVPSATEPGSIVLNGMSNSTRNSKWANAGVVVQIEPGDEPEKYKSAGAFSLMKFQRDVEKSMFKFVESWRKFMPNINPQAAPAQRMVDFCEGRVSQDLPESSYHPGVIPAPLHKILPPIVADRLKAALPSVGKLPGMRGWYTNEALLLGVESRTSSPVRIVRDPDTFMSPSLPGLFPCGEGAGYSGGIVSSAIDGINCAAAAVEFLRG